MKITGRQSMRNIFYTIEKEMPEILLWFIQILHQIINIESPVPVRSVCFRIQFRN